MTTSSVTILVRTAIDWAAMTPADFGTQIDPDRPLLFITYAHNNDVLGLWDRSFTMDYFAYRARMAAIARDNHRQVRGATIRSGLDGFDDWLQAPGDEWVLPVDDDDYFDPGLAQRLGQLAPSQYLVIWPEQSYLWAGEDLTVVGETATVAGAPFVTRSERDVLWTNNWAVRRSFLRDRVRPETARKMLTDHSFATMTTARLNGLVPPVPDPWFEIDLHGAGITKFAGSHSLTAKHPGSLFFMWVMLQTDDPDAELRVRRFGDRAPIPAEVSWATPWVREMEDLLASARRPTTPPGGIQRHG